MLGITLWHSSLLFYSLTEATNSNVDGGGACRQDKQRKVKVTRSLHIEYNNYIPLYRPIHISHSLQTPSISIHTHSLAHYTTPNPSYPTLKYDLLTRQMRPDLLMSQRLASIPPLPSYKPVDHDDEDDDAVDGGDVVHIYPRKDQISGEFFSCEY